MKALRFAMLCHVAPIAAPIPGWAQAVNLPVAPDSAISHTTIVLGLPAGGGYQINHQSIPREDLGAQFRAIYSPRPTKVLVVMWDPQRSSSDVMGVVQIARTEGLTVYRAPIGFETPREILQPGKWTGSTIGPGGMELQLTYDVTLAGDSMQIVVNTGDRGSYPFSEVRLVNDTLSFTFQPGPTVTCVLPREADGSFSGTGRSASTGDMATMRMVPPKGE